MLITTNPTTAPAEDLWMLVYVIRQRTPHVSKDSGDFIF
jgi:hypothetical protein